MAKGAAGLTEFSMDSIKDPNIRQLFGKVKLLSDQSFESKKDNIRGAEVEIRLTNNNSFKKKFRLPKGEPENPATTEALTEKFRSCIGLFWSEPKKEEVIHAIEEVDQLKDIRLLTKLLVSETSGVKDEQSNRHTVT